MNRGLRELDLDAVQEAVEVLRSEGFAVEGVDDVLHIENGVEFDLTLFASTRTKPMNPVVEAFNEALRSTLYGMFDSGERGPAVVVSLRGDVDPDKFTERLRGDSRIRNVEVVEANEEDTDPNRASADDEEDTDA